MGKQDQREGINIELHWVTVLGWGCCHPCRALWEKQRVCIRIAPPRLLGIYSDSQGAIDSWLPLRQEVWESSGRKEGGPRRKLWVPCLCEWKGKYQEDTCGALTTSPKRCLLRWICMWKCQYSHSNANTKLQGTQDTVLSGTPTFGSRSHKPFQSCFFTKYPL